MAENCPLSLPSETGHAMTESIVMPAAPSIPGLTFRSYRGPRDLPAMVSVANASCAADGIEVIRTVADMEKDYEGLFHCDPFRDIVLVEVLGELVGYARCWWWEEVSGALLLGQWGFVAPRWRRLGIGRAMVAWIESRQREIASAHGSKAEGLFQVLVTEHQVGLAAMLEKAGYQATRHFFRMVRPTLDAIPSLQLPDGLELRPPLAEHHRAIWDAGNDAFDGYWGRAQEAAGSYEGWLTSETAFQPHLWVVAWDVSRNEIAGQVRTLVNHAQNDKFNRRQGFVELVAVRKSWRNRGVARALLAKSLQIQRDEGSYEVALSVDSQNISGATRVYESCGFAVVKRTTAYRKLL